jgi:hypothetical protein
MIGVPVQTIDNTTPPTVALLAFGCAQTGIARTLAPRLNRALRAGLVRRVLSIANNNVMALYLWHMIPVVIVAVVGYPAGLLPQPTEGTADWWLARLEWVVILGLVTAVELALLWWGRRPSPPRFRRSGYRFPIGGGSRSCWPVPPWLRTAWHLSPRKASPQTGTFRG